MFGDSRLRQRQRQRKPNRTVLFEGENVNYLCTYHTHDALCLLRAVFS